MFDLSTCMLPRPPQLQYRAARTLHTRAERVSPVVVHFLHSHHKNTVYSHARASTDSPFRGASFPRPEAAEGPQRLRARGVRARRPLMQVDQRATPAAA